jgi:hypothetical protein
MRSLPVVGLPSVKQALLLLLFLTACAPAIAQETTTLPDAPIPVPLRKTLYDLSSERDTPWVLFSEVADTDERVDGLPVLTPAYLCADSIMAIVAPQSPGFSARGYSYVYVAGVPLPLVVCGDAKTLGDQVARLTGRKVASLAYEIPR